MNSLDTDTAGKDDLVYLAGLAWKPDTKVEGNPFTHPAEIELTKNKVNFTLGDHVFRLTHIYCTEHEYDKAVEVLKNMDPKIEELVLYRDEVRRSFGVEPKVVDSQ